MKVSCFSDTKQFSVEVESLRGIAALLVLMGHFYLGTILSKFHLSSQILSTFVGCIFNPQPAVLLFFTISGLVLGRQLRKEPVNNFFTLSAFLCRRAFRLLPLMWASIIFSFILNYFNGINTGFSVLYGNLTLKDISLNAPIWSLKVEIYCSIFFPILFWLFSKCDMVWNVLLFIILCVMSCIWQNSNFFQFFVFFHAGLLVDHLNANYKKKHPLVNLWVLIFSCLVFKLAPESFIGGKYWQFWLLPEILACSYILFFILHKCNSLLNRFLCLSLVRYLGKISFSVYLFHYPLLYFLQSKLLAHCSFVCFTVAYLVSTLLISAFTYRWIELPINQFGKFLSSTLFSSNKSRSIEEAAFISNGGLGVSK